ncbi:MAG: glycosyltransferase [Polaromonas sp.]|nr:glycosyltransferase [Polaromonas sp.]
MSEQSAPVLVSVLMPVYNAGCDLRLAVISVVRQTFTSWELILMDDGSTDDAFASIADINDARIHIHRDGHNRGLAARLNEACDLARGAYMARMDQDDVSFPDRFACQVQALQADSALDVVAVRAITIDERGDIVGHFPFAGTHAEICAKPWRGFYFPHPAWMGRVEWFRKFRYASPGPYFCEDQELLLRSYQQSHFRTLDQVLFAYRVRSQTNWTKVARTRRAMLGHQWDVFGRSNMWGSRVLALAAFAVKNARDLVSRLSGQPLASGSGEPVDADLRRQWQQALGAIRIGESPQADVGKAPR